MTVDPFVSEIVRHRLSTIVEEGALALQRVSGSPLATEAFDMNASLMNARGEVVFVGPYLLTGPMGQGLIVRKILQEYAESPGIHPGDMFICNDPYSGAAHQNCVTVVSPIHDGDTLIAWSGATLHVVDVGGPRAGQVGVGAQSIHEEAPVIPPLRIVQGGRLMHDVEENYLRRSRTPELNALDLRGKIAALNTIGARVSEVVATHGQATFTEVMEGVLDRAVEELESRLLSLPDGTFQHTAFLYREDLSSAEEYAIRLRLTKEGPGLDFDWTGSSLQAGAVINCTESALLSGVLIGVLTYLGWNLPWCPGAVERVIELRSTPGTVVDASWPAGCSMATMAAGFAVTTATAVCMGRLLAADPETRSRAMATWAGAVGSVDVFGVRPDGGFFGTVLLDSMISGTGATPERDGIDGGGFLRSIGCVVANVETYEARFPLMYLWRRMEPDTGGPGHRRGGVGCSYAVVAHGVEAIDHLIPHFSGTRQAESVGLEGGFPGATNQPWVVRGGRSVSVGRLPETPDELDGELEALPGIAHLRLQAGDVFGVVVTGGGGWGDPLDRSPAEVVDDVADLVVTRDAARSLYGVVVDDAGGLDEAGTSRVRSELHAERAARADPLSDSDAARYRDLACSCGHGGVALADRPMSAAGPHVAPHWPEAPYHLLEVYCMDCWRLLSVERVREGAPE